MKIFKVLVLGILFLMAMKTALRSQYLDVGDDPEKIRITKLHEIAVPAGYVFKDWSPDGEYFIFTMVRTLDGKTGTCIFKKNGLLFRKYDQYEYFDKDLWSADSKKIMVIDAAYNNWIIDILTDNKIKIQVDYESEVHGFNRSNGKVVFSNENGIFELDPANQSKSLVYKDPNALSYSPVMIHENCVYYT